MEIIDFFESDKQAHWLTEINRSDWDGAKLLHELLTENTFFNMVGENSKLLLLTDGDRLMSFCTYSKYDDIQPTDLTPWIGFVFTFPEYRGNRRMGLLIAHAEQLAKNAGFSAVYISTDHTGLYEKYGYTYFQSLKDIHGYDSRVYIKRFTSA